MDDRKNEREKSATPLPNIGAIPDIVVDAPSPDRKVDDDSDNNPPAAKKMKYNNEEEILNNQYNLQQPSPSSQRGSQEPALPSSPSILQPAYSSQSEGETESEVDPETETDQERELGPQPKPKPEQQPKPQAEPEQQPQQQPEPEPDMELEPELDLDEEDEEVGEEAEGEEEAEEEEESESDDSADYDIWENIPDEWAIPVEIPPLAQLLAIKEDVTERPSSAGLEPTEPHPDFPTTYFRPVPVDQARIEYYMSDLGQQDEALRGRKTLVLDMDHTLIYSWRDRIFAHPVEEQKCERRPNNFDFLLRSEDGRKEFRFFVKKRPHLDRFLIEVARLFEVVVFTSAQQNYADAILDQIDPNDDLISHRRYRQHCFPENIDGRVYHRKDLQHLNRDMSQIVFIDNSVADRRLYPWNSLRISSFRGADNDNELLNKLEQLRDISRMRSVHEYILLRMPRQ